MSITRNPFTWSGRLKRGAAVIVPAGIVTFGLFTAMHNLVEVDDFSAPPMTTYTLDPYMAAETEPVEHKRPPKPERQEPIDPPPLTPDLVKSVTNLEFPSTIYIGVAPAEYPMGEPDLIKPQPAAIDRDRNMRPLTPPVPTYPTKAATNGIEGTCEVHLSVTPKGEPFNVDAICTDRVFERSAEKAIKKVRFAPKIRDGKSVTVTGVVYPLEFRMEP